jgi:triacylglycerol lipase
MKLYARSLLSAAATALALAVTQPAMADDTRGPAPTVEALQADSGPFAVATYKISPSSALWYGYRGATVYYPKDTGQRFGVVTFTPGYTALQAVYAPLAERIASHGFVVVNIDTFTVYDQPAQRATEMAGALKQVIALARKGSVPYAGSIDDTRRAVVGHSMGGGGTLI